MKISVLIPTRQRTDVLYRGIDSVINQAHDISNLELIFRFDEDDDYALSECMKYYQVEPTNTIDKSADFKWGNSDFKVIETFSKKHSISMRFIVGKRHGYVLLNRYYDEMCFMSTGEYLLIWTDDMILLDNDRYDGWDTLVNEGKDQIYLFTFDWQDGYPRIVPRKFYELNNRLSPNVLDDRYWIEVMKTVDIHVGLAWKADHHCQWDNNEPLISGKDITASEGRGEFIKHRRGTVGSKWQFFDIKDLNRIKNYLDENPNHTKTSQKHNPENFFGQDLNKHPDCWEI